jgi:uncharacterized membrane protein
MKLLERIPERDRNLEQSFLIQRRGMAVLAGAFPFIFLVSSFVLQHTQFQPSISAYYWTHDMERNLFVGVLCAIGAFLVLYKGYTIFEDWTLNVAGVCAAGIALFPTPHGDGGTWLHYVFAGLFFACIFIVCIFMSDNSLKEMPDKKRAAQFRRWYHRCARVMVVSVVVALAGRVLLEHEYFTAILKHGGIFVFEATGIWSFAAFWYIKTRELDPQMSWVPFRKKPPS